MDRIFLQTYVPKVQLVGMVCRLERAGSTAAGPGIGRGGPIERTLRPKVPKLACPQLASQVTAWHVLQRTETTPAQAAILKALKISEPKRFLAIAPTQANHTTPSA